MSRISIANTKQGDRGYSEHPLAALEFRVWAALSAAFSLVAAPQSIAFPLLAYAIAGIARGKKDQIGEESPKAEAKALP